MPTTVDHAVKPDDQITSNNVAIDFVQAFVPSVRVYLMDHLSKPGGSIGVEQLIDVVANRIAAAVKDVDRQCFRNPCLPRWLGGFANTLEYVDVELNRGLKTAQRVSDVLVGFGGVPREPVERGASRGEWLVEGAEEERLHQRAAALPEP